MKNKNIYIWVVAALLLVGLSYFFVSNKSVVANRENKDSIKIGIMLPLSGDFAGIGEGIKNAANLAINEYKVTNPDIDISTVVEDDKFDVKTGVAAYTKLRSADSIDTLFMVSTPVLDAMHEQMTKDGLPIISIGLQNDGIAKDNIFQTSGEPITIISDMAKYMNNKSYNNVAVIYNSKVTANVRFFEAFAKTYTGKYTDFKLDVESDAKTIALKIKSSSPDAILIMNMPSIGARLTKELKSLEVKGDYYYDPQLSTGLAEYKKILGDMNVLNGAYTAYLKSGDKSKVNDFNAKYKAKYGTDPAPFSDYGYDSMKMLLSAYSKDKNTWMQNLQNTNTDGPSGIMTFDQNGVRVQDTDILRVVDGEIK